MMKYSIPILAFHNADQIKLNSDQGMCKPGAWELIKGSGEKGGGSWKARAARERPLSDKAGERRPESGR